MPKSGLSGARMTWLFGTTGACGTVLLTITLRLAQATEFVLWERLRIWIWRRRAGERILVYCKKTRSGPQQRHEGLAGLRLSLLVVALTVRLAKKVFIDAWSAFTTVCHLCGLRSVYHRVSRARRPQTAGGKPSALTPRASTLVLVQVTGFSDLWPTRPSRCTARANAYLVPP